jgi:hypothetical protein
MVGAGNRGQPATLERVAAIVVDGTAIAVEQKERMDCGRRTDGCGDRTVYRSRHVPHRDNSGQSHVR